MSECEELISQAEKGLIPITIDLIRELREKGYDYQAQMLLEAYHTSKKNNNLQFKKELDHIAFRIHNFEYRRLHPEAIKAWKEKAKERRLLAKKCQGCHKSFTVPRLKLCPICKEKHYKKNMKRAEKRRMKALMESKLCKGCGKHLRVSKLQYHPECLVKHQKLRYLKLYSEKKKRLEVENGGQV